MNPKKLKPGLVASYDLWPENRDGLFWFRSFTNLSLTYILRHLTHLLTAPGHTRGNQQIALSLNEYLKQLTYMRHCSGPARLSYLTLYCHR